MKCAVHSDVDAVAYCRNCGKALCAACSRPVRDVIYCEDCLAAHLGLPTAVPQTPGTSANAVGNVPYTANLQDPYAASQPMATPAPGIYPAAIPGTVPAAQRINNPGVAFILGLIPGLGAVYNGEYNKALIHIVVFAAMIVGLSSDLGDGATVSLALLLAGFVFYMAFDAMRTAKARGIGQAQIDPLESWSRERPIGPIILIGLGGLFLLNNFSWFAFYRVRQLWPLALIGVGILMFRNRVRKDL